MAFDNLLLDRDGAVATLTINRPAVLNALNASTLDDLQLAMQSVQSDAAVNAVVLTGAGSKAFVAGADIRELATLTSGAARALAERGQTVFDLIETLGKPVVAAINGFAFGGGCELAMACTLRVAADSARLGQPEINLGLMPGYGGTQRLARLVGGGRALELLLTGAPIDAAEAHRIGLVNRVVPAEELMTVATSLAAQLAAQAPVAVRSILDAVNHGRSVSFAAAQAYEAALFALLADTEDMHEGTKAFLEKRPPIFKAR
jgi:enoyl-CoA hydratase